MKKSKTYLIWTIIVTVLAVAINVFIIVHSCLNASESGEASRGVVDFLKDIINTFSPNAINDGNYDSFASFIRKAVGHFGLFVISGLLTSLTAFLWLNPLKKFKYWMLIIMALGFGLFMGTLTEIIQLNVPGRSGELTDVLIDFSGYLLGFSIVFLILFLIIRKNQKHQTPSE